MTTVRTLLIASLAGGSVIEHALPFLSGPGRLFGVPVPSGFCRHPEGRRLIRRYELALLCWTGPCLLMALLFPPGWSLGMLAAFVPSKAIWAFQLYVLGAREARGFALPDNGTRQAVLAEPGGELRRIAVRFLPALGVLAAAGLYLRANWSRIPPRFAVHWAPDGTPNGSSNRTAAGVYGPLLFGSLIVIFMAGTALAIRHGARRGRPAAVAGSVATATAYLIAAAFSAVAMLPLHYIPIWVVLLMIGAYGAIVAIIVVAAARQHDAGEIDLSAPDTCWRGPFYYNPDDPAIFVQSRVGSAFTLNFGQRAAWLLLALGLAYLAVMFFAVRLLWGAS